MSIKFCNGDLLESGCSLICHQVNCLGAMNSGIAKNIRKKWPVVFKEYSDWYYSTNSYENFECPLMFGHIQIVSVNDKQKVINMASQRDYGYDNQRYTSYDAFYNCLCEITLHAKLGSRIGFPQGIGSVRGGANWNIILKMIEEVLGEDYQVEIWRYDRG